MRYSLLAVYKYIALILILCVVLSCSQENRLAKQQPVILEIISQDTTVASQQTLQRFLQAGDELFRWKTHFIIYSQTGKINALQDSIQSRFPAAELKVYDDLYYNFNRSYCSDTVTAKEWEHTILTANLVQDTALQNEYYRYHETQFEAWPQVAEGFCKAEFQQLIMFRNGRQLMLVISIPKGKSLDELNPKTTENNPKVDEWNSIMAKYQEGIAGTAEGEVWALFGRIKN